MIVRYDMQRASVIIVVTNAKLRRRWSHVGLEIPIISYKYIIGYYIVEPTQTCLAPVDLHPIQVLAQMGITELAQVAKSGYMFSMEDLSRIFGEKFGNIQKGAYNQMCKTLCKGGEQDGLENKMDRKLGK